MGLSLCRIEYQPDVAYESLAYKKECNVIFVVLETYVGEGLG